VTISARWRHDCRPWLVDFPLHVDTIPTDKWWRWNGHPRPYVLKARIFLRRHSVSDTTQEADGDIDRIAKDIQALKRDLARLMEHVKTGATETVSGEASRLYDSIASEGQRHAATLAQSVEEKPLASVLIAFAIGFVSGRILLR
jgi:ElaB/YqjD/DUF883 family membrane-anchored ribosome-binding protein